MVQHYYAEMSLKSFVVYVEFRRLLLQIYGIHDDTISTRHRSKCVVPIGGPNCECKCVYVVTQSDALRARCFAQSRNESSSVVSGIQSRNMLFLWKEPSSNDYIASVEPGQTHEWWLRHIHNNKYPHIVNLNE